MDKNVVIIGAGIGGICSAIRLAKAGLRVTIVEKNARPGGRCDRISRDGHHFDTCLLYISPSPRDRTRSRMPSSA